MAVNLSPLGGVAAQFFNNDGVPLAGGLIYTYAAGTNTPQATYTTGAGNIEHSNPIVLDSAGRVPSGEIWLTDGAAYKFVIKDANLTLIGTYDNIVGINSNFINYSSSQEIQTATAGQTVFTLTTMAYQPGTNSLSVFVDGVNQYGPGAQYAYTETSSTSVTFNAGLHVGAQVKFTTSVINNVGGVDALQVTYNPPFTGGVSTNVEAKLSEYVSVKDFGAVGDGVTDDTLAIQSALDSGQSPIYFPPGNYISGALTIDTAGQIVQGAGPLLTNITSNASPQILFTVGADHVQIKDMKLQCGDFSVDPTTGDTVGIKTTTGAYCTFSNIITNQWALGIQLGGGIRNTITKCRIIVDTHSYAGIDVSGGGEHTIIDNMVQDSSGDNFVGIGLIYVYDSPANVISNNYITRGQAIGIHVTAPLGSYSNNYTVIENNDIDSIWNWGIYAYNQKQIHIKDNWLSAGQRVLNASVVNATGQIYLYQCQEVYVTNNDIYQSQGETAGVTPISPSQPSHGLLMYETNYGYISGNMSQYNSVGFSCTHNCSQIQFVGNTTGQLVGLADQGTPQKKGFVDDGTSVANSYLNNLVWNLDNPTAGYDYINIDSYVVPDINQVVSWTNLAYNTFVSTRANITSAICTTSFANADSSNSTVIAGRYYQATIYVVSNSGQLPSVNIYSGDGLTIDKSSALSAGINVITYKASTSGSGAHLNINNSAAANFSLNAKLIQVTF